MTLEEYMRDPEFLYGATVSSKLRPLRKRLQSILCKHGEHSQCAVYEMRQDHTWPFSHYECSACGIWLHHKWKNHTQNPTTGETNERD